MKNQDAQFILSGYRPGGQDAHDPKFAEALRALGVEPPTKVSKTTGKKALALAKNDALFQALLNGSNEDVALLCEARLKVKSTTERTRAQRFLDILFGQGAAAGDGVDVSPDGWQ